MGTIEANVEMCEEGMALPLGNLGGRLRPTVEEGTLSQVSKT